MEKRNQNLFSGDVLLSTADQIDITFYTDPLCCWGWAWQPEQAHLQKMLGDQASWHLTMAGLIPDWKYFHDDVNSVSKAVQMGPIWMHAGQIAGRSICHQLWMTDPPSSSYPACIAVKSACLQSPELGFAMLRELQSACMSRGENIAKKSVLNEVAVSLASNDATFSLEKFSQTFTNGDGKELFSQDLDLTRKNQITRFPSLIVSAGGKKILIPGYRDSLTVFNAIKNIAPELIDQC